MQQAQSKNEAIKHAAKSWFVRGDFNVFGTLTYEFKSLITAGDVEKHARFVFNSVDRGLYGRRRVEKGERLQRLVIMETGRTRTQPHIHFWLKIDEQNQEAVVMQTVKRAWQTLPYHGAVDFRPVHQLGLMMGYAVKEFTSQSLDGLLTSCSHF